VWSTVGVEGGDGEGDVAAGEANSFPVERRGDLERNVSKRGAAVIAQGEESANGDLLRGRAEMNVQVEGGEGEGFAFGVGGDGGGDGLALQFSARRGRRWWWSGRCRRRSGRR